MTSYSTTENQPARSTNPFRPSPMTADEVSKVTQIVEITQVSEEVALKYLRRKEGNLEQAIDAILEVPVANVANSPGDIESLRAAAAGVVTTVPKSGKSSPPIDLTGDDDEDMNRAIQASTEDQGPAFRPSDRAPHPSWAMVPSNVAVHQDVVSQDDQQMTQAIEASLVTTENDGYDEVSLEERVRKGHCPVALRPTLPTLSYAGLLLHALFFVPQVRESVACWRPSSQDHTGEEPPIIDAPTNGAEWTLWSLLELFVNMDLARMSELNVDKCMNAFEVLPWEMRVERPGDITYDFYNKLAWMLETMLRVPLATDLDPLEWPRLFHFRFNYSDAEYVPSQLDNRFDMAVVKVDIRGTPDANDLLSCLSLDLFPERHQRQQAIFRSSEVVAFQLMRNHPTSGDREIFSFPPYLYLDQFLKENVDLANSKRRMQWELNAEMERLNQRQVELTRNQNRDVPADLRSSIYYFENVAECEDDERKALVEDTLTKLRGILAAIESELEDIKAKIADYRAQAATAFDCPELQKYKYDLRVVLVHDGLHGRSHLYSYVKYKGVWWKTVDYVVTEVSEAAVLNDVAGLHLSAGPYFLIYSAALTEDENVPMPWPEFLKDSVKHNNIAFFSTLPEEIRASVVDPNSPPTTPYIPPVIVQEEEVSTLQEETIETNPEQMEID